MMSKTLKGLILFSLFTLVSASVGAAFAIATHLPARFGGMLTGNDVLQDFLQVNGTALSPDLAMLLGQLALTICALWRGRGGMVGVVGLTIYGACVVCGQLGEPIVVQAFSPATFNVAQASLVAANMVFPLLMFVSGVLEWRSRRQTSRATCAQPEFPAAEGRS